MNVGIQFACRCIRAFVLTAAVVSMAACGGQEDLVSFSLNFGVTDDAAQPLAGVKISVEGKELKASGVSGNVRLIVQKKNLSVIKVSWHCPTGYRQPKAGMSLTLKKIADLDGAKVTGISTKIQCAPELRRVALVVKTNRKRGLPILVNGAVVTRTNSQGVATYSRSLKPGATLNAQIDTSDHLTYHPPSPEKKWTVEDGDQIYVFDQVFERGRKIETENEADEEAAPKPPPSSTKKPIRRVKRRPKRKSTSTMRITRIP